MTKVQNRTATKRAGKILKIRAQTKRIILLPVQKLPAMRKPLVTKKISTAIPPNDIPISALIGSECPNNG